MIKLRENWQWSSTIVVLLAVCCILPFVLRPFQLEMMIFMFLYIMAVSSFRLISVTGEFSLAHAVIMGCGAYSSTLLYKYLGLSPWLSIPIGALVAALISFLLTFSLFRMKMFYFLIGSFAAAEAIRLCWVYFQGIFGGFRGIGRLPALEVDIPGVVYIDLGHPFNAYFFLLIVLIFVLIILYRIEHSRFGLNFHATHWQDLLAGSVGVNCRSYRTIAFTIAGGFVGLAGGLLAHYVGAVNPQLFALGLMLYILVWAIVGGLGHFAGPVIGVVVLSIIDEFARSQQEFRPMIYGAILIGTILFLPDGLVSLPSRLKPIWNRIRGAD